jgi:predicted RNA-binding protein
MNQERKFFIHLLQGIHVCESTVFRIKNDEKERLMDDVALITVDGEKLTLSGVFGENR